MNHKVAVLIAVMAVLAVLAMITSCTTNSTTVQPVLIVVATPVPIPTATPCLNKHGKPCKEHGDDD